MRSPLGPVLAILGLAATVVLVLVLVQNLGLRGDLDRVDADLAGARADLSALRDELQQLEPGIDRDELKRQLDILESGIRDWLIATGADGFDPDASGSPVTGGPVTGGSNAEVLDRLDELMEGIEGLSSRLDQICEGVPVC